MPCADAGTILSCPEWLRGNRCRPDPSVFSVQRFTFIEKLWIPVTTILLLATAAGAGYGIRKVEHHRESTAPKHQPPDYR